MEIKDLKAREELQIETDLLFVKALTELPDKLKNMKTVNKKTVEKLNVEGLYVSLGETYTGDKTLVYRAKNRYVHKDQGDSVIYIGSASFEIKISDVGTRGKINVDMAEIENKKQNLERYIQKIRHTINNIDKMKKEYEEIRQRVTDYKKEYEYSIMRDLYLNRF